MVAEDDPVPDDGAVVAFEPEAVPDEGAVVAFAAGAVVAFAAAVVAGLEVAFDEEPDDVFEPQAVIERAAAAHIATMRIFFFMLSHLLSSLLLYHFFCVLTEKMTMFKVC